MDCQKMDLIELLKVIFLDSKGPKRSNLAVLLRFANFLKNGLINFLYFLYTASWE